jgi:hypothetical protein
MTTSNNSLSLIINGLIAKPETTCPALDVAASVQITDEFIDIYQTGIDGLINQLGKNVLLNFNPVKDQCRNCYFDSIRQRSTGIYRTSPVGPRPFARGRKCPWCKGRGYEETVQQKCIKCLIKWNPRELKDYGLSVSDKTDIVMFKTYAYNFDDISRAKTAYSNIAISDIKKFLVKLIKGPVLIGLRESRYCISFWELIDG